MEDNQGLLFKISRNSFFLQNLVINIISSVHPAIEHNVEKIQLLKKAFFHCELEKIKGSYFEFGVFEGTSLYGAVKISKKLRAKSVKTFYGFDSFDQGFKYFTKEDEHPFFKEGDFTSSFAKVKKRFKKFPNVKLIKGYFEETVANKDVTEVCGPEKCSIIFIDCDLMNPALIALSFIKPALQPGAVIVLDDYWAYRGNPQLGTCGALNQFLHKNPSVKVRPYYNYGHGGSSFIVTEV